MTQQRSESSMYQTQQVLFPHSRTLVVLATVLTTLYGAAFSTIGHAQEQSQEIVPIEEGARVPFSGMLFPTETAVRWRQRIELLEERLRLDVQKCEEIAQLRLQLVSDTLQLRTEQYEADREMLRESIVEVGERSFLEEPVVWLVIGVVVGVVASVVTFALLE